MNLRDKAFQKAASHEKAAVDEINKAALTQAIHAELVIARLERDDPRSDSFKSGEIRSSARYRDASISILAIGTGIPFQSWLDTVRAIVLEEYQ